MRKKFISLRLDWWKVKEWNNRNKTMSRHLIGKGKVFKTIKKEDNN